MLFWGEKSLKFAQEERSVFSRANSNTGCYHGRHTMRKNTSRISFPLCVIASWKVTRSLEHPIICYCTAIAFAKQASRTRSHLARQFRRQRENPAGRAKEKSTTIPKAKVCENIGKLQHKQLTE